MRLESALLASREGITSHGQAISVVGDNIANANTTGFKASRAEFDDLMAESPNDRGAEVVSGAGDGVGIGAIRTMYEGGLVEPTGRQLDVAIQGTGFFLVGDKAAPQFTRAGALQISKDGLLVNSGGLPILGYQGTDQATLGSINMYDVKTTGAATSAVKIFGNLGSSGPTVTVPQNPATFRELNQNATFSTSHAVYDSLGAQHDFQVSYFKTGVGTWTVQAHVDAKETGGTPGQPLLLGQATLTFDGQGAIPAASQANAVINANNLAWANGSAPGNFTIDLSPFTQYGNNSQLANTTQNGQAAGSVMSYEFDDDGGVFAVLDSGARAQIGSIPLGTVRNLDGLVRSGSSTFEKGATAGETSIGRAASGSFGKISGRSLERSTVDISQQFVDLVVFQRGYQANSNALSAANELIQGTLGLLR